MAPNDGSYIYEGAKCFLSAFYLLTLYCIVARLSDLWDDSNPLIKIYIAWTFFICKFSFLLFLQAAGYIYLAREVARGKVLGRPQWVQITPHRGCNSLLFLPRISSLWLLTLKWLFLADREPFRALNLTLLYVAFQEKNISCTNNSPPF